MPTVASAVAPPTQSASMGLATILRVLKRHKFLILFCTLLGTILSVVYTYRQPVLYQAMARVDVDLSNPAYSIAAGAGASGVGGGSSSQMGTQLGILTSQTIAWNVIQNLALYKNPSFVGPGAHPAKSSDISEENKISLIRHFGSGLSAQFEKETEIAQIKYTNVDPELAAAIANAVADAYIERNYQSRYVNMHKTVLWLDGQLDNLRRGVAASEKEFADFQRQTGIFQTDENHSAELDRFQALNTALTNAELQRINREIDYRASLTLEPDQVTPSISGISATRAQLANLEAEYASLTAKYGNAYPRVIQLGSQIAQVKTNLQDQTQFARRQLEADYQQALNDENRLRAMVATQKQLIFSTNETTLQYSILQHEVTAQRDLYEDLTRRLQEAELNSGLNANAISVLDPALRPNVPISPNKSKNIEAGFMGGLFLGIACCFFLENINATVTSVEDVKIYANLSIVGLVPHTGPQGIGLQGVLGYPLARYAIENPRSHFAEAFKHLRSALLLSSAGTPPRLIAVCSAWPQEGKSTISINLAISLAQMGKRVLLVDADLRRPTLHVKFGVPRSKTGLSALLTDSELSILDPKIYSDVGIPSLTFLSSGLSPPFPSELLMSDRMAYLCDQWREQFDFIVVDTAPVLAVSDTSSLVQIADATLLVIRAGTTRRQALRAARDSIMAVKGKLVGVLMNDVKASSDMYYDYYGGRGDYGAYYYNNDQK